jgi:hypothetical protein
MFISTKLLFISMISSPVNTADASMLVDPSDSDVDERTEVPAVVLRNPIEIIEVTEHRLTSAQEEELLGPILTANDGFASFCNATRIQQFDAMYEGYYIHMDEKLIEHYGPVGNDFSIQQYLEHVFGSESDIQLAFAPEIVSDDRKPLVTDAFRDRCRRHMDNRDYYRDHIEQSNWDYFTKRPPSYSATDRRPVRSAQHQVLPFSRINARLKVKRDPPITDAAMESIRKGVEDTALNH